MKQQPYPPNSPEARKLARQKRRRRLRILRASMVLTVVLVLLLVVGLVILRAVGVSASRRGETTSFLAIKHIEVEGESRYPTEDIIEKSGLYVGQSLLAINKVQAHDALLRAFPYLEWVDIGNTAFDTVRIRLRETTVLGAVPAGDTWLVVGSNNRGLELLEEAALPADTMRITGAELLHEGVGDNVLEERSLRICKALLDAAQKNELTGLTAIDITEKTNICLWWNGRVRIVLGNESNLAKEMERLPGILENLLKNNGQDVGGRLDMSSYSDDDPDNDKAIFTPQELLQEQQEKQEQQEAQTQEGAQAEQSAQTQDAPQTDEAE